jgi:hypothetical protein
MAVGIYISVHRPVTWLCVESKYVKACGDTYAIRYAICAAIRINDSAEQVAGLRAVPIVVFVIGITIIGQRTL